MKKLKVVENNCEHKLVVEVLVLFDQWRQVFPSPEKFCSGIAVKTFEESYQKSELFFSPVTEVSIVLCEDKFIQNLNLKYRDLNKPTNVLSFSNFSGSKTEVERVGRLSLLGDIVVSYETVRKESKVLEKGLEGYTAHMIVHGMLHLMGFVHDNIPEAMIMERLEKKILNKLF